MYVAGVFIGFWFVVDLHDNAIVAKLRKSIMILTVSLMSDYPPRLPKSDPLRRRSVLRLPLIVQGANEQPGGEGENV